MFPLNLVFREDLQIQCASSPPCLQTIEVICPVSKNYVSQVFVSKEKDQTLRFVSWIRAKDRATIMAHPTELVNGSAVIEGFLLFTVEAGLQGRMLARAAFTVVIIHNQCPRLLSSFKLFGSLRNGTRHSRIVIKGLVYVASFIVDGLKIVGTMFLEKSNNTP
jgi:hypothetical protein